MPKNPEPEEVRFWKKVNKNGPDGCWIWMASRTRDGYGQFRFFRKDGKAHRYSYILHKGPIPEGMEVCHKCHNPACVNPAHLKLGTRDDNMRDLAISGRRKGFHHRPKTWYTVSKPKTIEARFWSKVNKNGPTVPHMSTPCWMWLAYRLPGGHGTFSVNGSIKLAHRISWEMHHNRPIPKGLSICHHCDNPACVNPAHLFLGTHKDNMQDMIKKGRGVSFKGEKQVHSKLTQKQVEEIRHRYASTNVTQVQLGKEYGVTQAAISAVIHRINWAWL